MSKSETVIKPFDFDRVFRFDDAPRDAGVQQAVMADLHTHLAELEAQLAAALQQKDEASEAAWAAGHAAGLEQARTERAEAQLAATDALHAAFDDLGAEFAAVTDQLTRDTAQLAHVAADILAGHAVRVEPTRAFEEALGRALQQLAFGVKLLIRTHPDSAAHFQEIAADQLARQGMSISINVVADDNIAPNDAHISWGRGGLIVDSEERRSAVLRELAPLLGQPAA